MRGKNTIPTQVDLGEELLDLLTEAHGRLRPDQVDLMTRWCLLSLYPAIDLTKPLPMPDLTML